jgi:hypothetical protein
MAKTIRKNNCVDKAADDLVLIAVLSDSEFNLENIEIKFQKNTFKI